ncbi:MAG: protein kinase domain-containing protein [Demequina sp.]|uniref:protein kinase domain-containing protein n=1 Tax=Demequina sp. TaxID=2050685 RepID=UPI003A851E7B
MSTAVEHRVPTLRRALGTGAGLAQRARERAARLSALGRDDVLAPVDVLTDGDTVSAALPVIDGVDLAHLAAQRGPLSAGECVWLGRRVARALAALHAAGLVHGDVSPANVVVRADGITLVDTLGAVRGDERGTPGFRAPEAVAGDMVEASDVFALGRLLRWAVCEEDEARVRAWTVPCVASHPGQRPRAGEVEAVLSWCAPERRVPLPRTDVAAAVRARAVARTERIAQGRWWRALRWTLRGIAVTGASGVLAGAVILMPRLLDSDAAAGTTADTTVSSDSPASAARQSAADAARALTEARIAALEAEDGTALLATVTGHGAVASDAATTAAALDNGDLVYEGLAVEVGAVAVTAEGEDSATVEVTYEITAHDVTTAGQSVSVTAETQQVQLSLVWVGDQWRVARAQTR